MQEDIPCRLCQGFYLSLAPYGREHKPHPLRGQALDIAPTPDQPRCVWVRSEQAMLRASYADYWQFSVLRQPSRPMILGLSQIKEQYGTKYIDVKIKEV